MISLKIFGVPGPAIAGALALMGATSAAMATTVALSGGPGSTQMAYSFQYLSPNSTTPTVGNDYNLAVPGIYSIGDTFANQPPTLPPLATSSVGAYDFQDSYRFTVNAAASGDTLVASLGLGTLVAMSNLQFRLYEVASATTNPIVPGIPAGSTSETVWVGQTGADTNTTVISKSFSGLQAGTYILDVAGIASGSLGGSYVGTVNLQAVPLPATGWLMLSGIGGLGAMARRRKAA
jgi:hypothetical protein